MRGFNMPYIDISGWIELKNRTSANFTDAAWHILDEDPDDEGDGTIEYSQ